MVLPNVFGPPTMVAAVVDFKDQECPLSRFFMSSSAPSFLATLTLSEDSLLLVLTKSHISISHSILVIDVNAFDISEQFIFVKL